MGPLGVSVTEPPVEEDERLFFRLFRNGDFSIRPDFLVNKTLSLLIHEYCAVIKERVFGMLPCYQQSLDQLAHDPGLQRLANR